MELDPWYETLGCGRFDEDRLQSASFGEANESVVAHGGERVELPAGFGVVGRGDQDQAFLDQAVGEVPAQQVGVHGADGDVDLAAVEGAEEFGDQAGAQSQGYPRVTAPELCHHAGQVQRSEDVGGTDADLAVHHGGEVVEVGAGAVGLGEDRSGPGQEHLASVGEHDASGGAFQQRCPQVGLQAADLGGDRRLGDVEVLGGSGEPAAAHDRFEVDELPQLHPFSMISDECKRKPVLDSSTVPGDTASMEQRSLGIDGFTRSALGMGCMGLSQGYGPTDDNESIRAIHRALEAGVTMLDTATSYGQGHNERLIARALAGQPEAVTVATKFGIVRDDDGVRLDGRPEHVAGYAEASLSRLGVKVIDLYYLHRVDPDVPIAETVGAMAQLVADGKVRHLGLSEVTADQIEAAAAVHLISAVQFEWSLLWRDPETDIVPAARRVGAGIVAYSPLGRGLLTAAPPTPSTPAISGAAIPASTVATLIATSHRSTSFAASLPTWTSPPASWPWPGCSLKVQTSYPSPEPAAQTASSRTSPPSISNSAPMT